ncbi:tRNA (5-methylaminomethyl-2-thiouridine)(34)-methyltransferase MnmD [Olleya sp. R77988]|uniref:tRNA (5-methylaminomethyl-2-thiouridine)(34)-methyltransferase MnmD n=1 Tax=Olleya sp. R77988 TaxID=3093875 RepID=UPI0037C8CB0F
MKPTIEITKDGSSTLVHPKYQAHYHSIYGAIEESNHVYINAGLLYFLSSEKRQDILQSCSILELGFGSGLNAFNTLLKTEALPVNINYLGIETDPVPIDVIKKLNYPELLQANEKQELFDNMHTVSWEDVHQITSSFSLEKRQLDIFKLEADNQFDLVYFDAFGPGAQPELWTEPIFKIMYRALKKGGVLITYCSQGAARRAMISVGFTVSRLPGPPNKRHILRAVKE